MNSSGLHPAWTRSARVAALVLSIAACTGDRGPILIGAAGNWDETYGVMNKRGIELAVEEINARGGLRGRTLQVIDRNDRGDGMQAVNVAAEFVANPLILAVVGHVNSGAMVAAARVYNQGLPAVATTASSPDLTGISPWVFRVISSDSVNGLDLARYARRLGFRRAAVLYENNSYGRGLAEAFERHFEGTVVIANPIPSDGASDFEPYISYLITRKPDVVLVAGTEPSGFALLKEARRRGAEFPFLGSDGWAGLVTDSATSEGAYVGAPFSPRDVRDGVQQFVEAFRQKHGMEPDGFAALAYDATMLIASAMRDGADTRIAIRDWLANRTEQTAFPGVTGAIRFLPSGDVVGKGYVMTRIIGGALVVDRGGRS